MTLLRSRVVAAWPRARERPAGHTASARSSAATVEGILAISHLVIQALVRIEAWRLLARCHGARGDAATACELLERAVSESVAVSYVWMEAAALKDMLQWVAEGEASAAVQARINATVTKFHAPDC